jgi:hypothetical protein
LVIKPVFISLSIFRLDLIGVLANDPLRPEKNDERTASSSSGSTLDLA